MEQNRVRRLIHGHTHRPKTIHEHRLKDSEMGFVMFSAIGAPPTFLVTEETNYDLRKFNYRA